MTKRDYRRRADTSAKSFRRTLYAKEPAGSAILVVTEGANTEPSYFDRIRNHLAAPTVELVPHGAGRGDPRALADEALRLRKERKSQMRDKKLGINRLEDFDAIWIVFDTDVVTPQKRTEGIAYAESKGIQIAYSEPCFEFWLLIHQAFTTAPMAKCKDVIPYLAEHLGWKGYARIGKRQQQIEEWVRLLVDKASIRQAVAHAEKIRRHHKEANTAFPANPSTDVDHLIRAINAAVSPANRFLG